MKFRLLAVVLLSSGGLLLSAFEQNAATNLGFDPDHVLGGQLRLSAVAYPTAANRWSTSGPSTRAKTSASARIAAATTGAAHHSGGRCPVTWSMQPRVRADLAEWLYQYQ